MQKYNNLSNDARLIKKLLSDFLGFLKYKVDNDRLTLDEEQAIVKLIEKKPTVIRYDRRLCQIL